MLFRYKFHRGGIRESSRRGKRRKRERKEEREGARRVLVSLFRIAPRASFSEKHPSDALRDTMITFRTVRLYSSDSFDDETSRHRGVNHSVYRAARIRSGDKFHAGVFTRVHGSKLSARRGGSGRSEGSRFRTARGHRSPGVIEPEFTDTSGGVLISISCPVFVSSVSSLSSSPAPLARVLTQLGMTRPNYRLNFIENVPQGRFARVRRQFLVTRRPRRRLYFSAGG